MGKDLCHVGIIQHNCVMNMSNLPRSASEVVRETIERDAVIGNGLARGLINVRALARFMQVEAHDEVTFESLVAAIRRYPVKETAPKRKGMGRLITKMGMKNKIADVTIRNEPEIPALLGKFSEQVDYGRGETLSIVSGSKNVRVVVDSKNLDKLIRMLPKKNILGILHDLAAVIITYDELAYTTPGFSAAMFNEIAMEGINLDDFVQSPPDGMFIVAEKDALRTYQALERLSNGR
jgi:hypothetical protein